MSPVYNKSDVGIFNLLDIQQYCLLLIAAEQNVLMERTPRLNATALPALVSVCLPGEGQIEKDRGNLALERGRE